MQSPILSIDNISVDFVRARGWSRTLPQLLKRVPRQQSMRVVNDVSLDIFKGEVLGLVGESGCGKSTIGRVVAGILEPTLGTRTYHAASASDAPVEDRSTADLAVQMVFQDHAASLNPRLRIDEAIGEAPVIHGFIKRSDQDAYVVEMMRRVGLDPATRRRYPHQFSGGQRARICIARALAVKPRILVCDESTAALDVSIQAQVLNLFMTLREQYGLTYLFVSHDLGVIQHISDRVAVMYFGRIVELAAADRLFSDPSHPYTQALLTEVPRLEPEKKRFAALKGEIPSPLHPPSGCHFHPRCPFAGPRCSVESPQLKELSPGHWAACHLRNGGVA